MGRFNRRWWRGALAFCLGVLSVVSITIGLMQATSGRQTEQILSELTRAHHAYAETRDLLGELDERAQAWVLLAGDPSERAQLEQIQAQAKASLLHFRELTPEALQPLLPSVDEIDAAIDSARVQLPTLSTEADLDIASHAVDARLENVLKEVGRVYAKRVGALEQQVKTLQDKRSRQTNDWFLCALVFLCASIWPVMRHLRQLGQEEGALRERGAILERISDGFIALDARWRYTYVNAAAERLLGHRREDLLGRNIWELFPSGEHDLRGDRYRRAMETQKPEIFERFVKESNSWYETRVHPSPEGLSIYFRDITEERRMRELLAASEARHRQIVETAQEGIWTFGPDGRTTFVNHKLTGLLGYRPEEMIGKPLFDFMDTEGQRIAANNLQRRALGLKDASDFRLRRKDGTELWVLMSTSALDDGDQAGVLAMLTDITERRGAESERARLVQRERSFHVEADASRQHVRVLADLMPNICWCNAPDGYSEWVNRALETFTGIAAEHHEGQGWQAIIHPADLPSWAENYKIGLMQGTPIEGAVRLRRFDGAYVVHHCRIEPVRGVDGRIVRWFGVAAAEPRPPPERASVRSEPARA